MGEIARIGNLRRLGLRHRENTREVELPGSEIECTNKINVHHLASVGGPRPFLKRRHEWAKKERLILGLLSCLAVSRRLLIAVIVSWLGITVSC